MSSKEIHTKKIAKNTIMLYMRMFFSMIVGLYTSRVVLATLGVEDYGIYGVVGGIVVMIGFLNSSMSAATSRFLTFELGRNEKDKLSKTFSSALIVHVMIAIVLLILAETIGLWFLSNKLVIPEERMTAAHIVYQISILSTMLSITQVPYNASIISHEKMDVYAYVEILNVILKLLIVYLLVIGNYDKLIFYAILSFFVSLIILIIYRVYSIKHFAECKFKFIWDTAFIKPLLSFSGWNLYYEGAFAARQQGANFILNMFCGVVYNAAGGIATTVQGIILGFSSNLVMAFRPQVIKTYALSDYENMNRLIQLGTKFGSVLLLAITLPVLFNCEYLLDLWLNQVPEGSVFMVNSLLGVNLVNTSSMLLVTSIHATGNIKFYSGIGGSIYLSTLFLMYICMLMGMDYRSIYLIILLTSVIVNFSYALILKRQVSQFFLRSFYQYSVFPMLILVALDSLIMYYMKPLFGEDFISFLLFSVFSMLLILVSAFIIALSKTEQQLVIQFLKSKFIK